MLDENKKMKTMGIFIGSLVLGSLIAVFMSLKIYHHLSYIYLIWTMNSIFSVTFGLLLLILAIYLLTNTSDKKQFLKVVSELSDCYIVLDQLSYLTCLDLWG
ncbi:hypothetical protein EFL19_09675 [Weissella paramesenteroides]|nr:hypothetical protein [Weissella paramesenteroides]